MSDKQYDSVLVGYADDARHNDEGELMSWSVRFKDTELKEMIDKYATRRNAEHGRACHPAHACVPCG